MYLVTLAVCRVWHWCWCVDISAGVRFRSVFPRKHASGLSTGRLRSLLTGNDVNIQVGKPQDVTTVSAHQNIIIPLEKHQRLGKKLIWNWKRDWWAGEGIDTSISGGRRSRTLNIVCVQVFSVFSSNTWRFRSATVQFFGWFHILVDDGRALLLYVCDYLFF